MLKKLLDRVDQILLRSRIKRRFKRYVGYTPDLDNPQSFCEKIQWLKLNQHANDTDVITRADKYLVKEFVRKKGYVENVVKLYGVYDQPEEIDWEKLPEQFVLKLNNASGENDRWFVEDKKRFDITEFKSQVRKRLKHKFGWHYGERHYAKTAPKIIAEEYLTDTGGSFKDYSFYCFNGKVTFISIEEGCRNGPTAIEYYNADWKKHPVDFGNDFPRAKTPYQKPEQLEYMIKMAEDLSDNYPLVRVDLYYINNHIYFGELTFTPESGFIEWRPVSLDYKYGELIDLTLLHK